MLLAFDIGNTNIVIGLFKNDQLTHKWRLLSDVKKSIDDYAIDIIELLLNAEIHPLKITGIIIGSVVPALTSKLFEASKKFCDEKIHEKIFVIGKNVDLKIDIRLEKESEVGHDRLINAIAAFKEFGDNLIIIDFGTATTFDVVGKNGEYLGGVIAPGINLSLKALHDMTAQLPRIEIKPQKNVIGKNTVEAMNSGVYFGYIAMIEGMIQKIESELNTTTKHIITGGLAEIFKDGLKNLFIHHKPDLTLEGLKIIHEQQQN